MNLLDSLQQKVGFTRREAIAILTLSGTFLAGMSIRWLQSNFIQQPPEIPAFNYSRSDSAYLYHSQRDSTKVHLSTQEHVAAQNKQKLSSLSKRILPVDINAATKEQLITLPGIGPAMAERILAYRKTVRRFASIEQLTNVKGIGKKSLDKLRPYLYMK